MKEFSNSPEHVLIKERTNNDSSNWKGRKFPYWYSV